MALGASNLAGSDWFDMHAYHLFLSDFLISAAYSKQLFQLMCLSDPCSSDTWCLNVKPALPLFAAKIKWAEQLQHLSPVAVFMRQSKRGLLRTVRGQVAQ